MIKTKEKRTVLFIGNRWSKNYAKRFRKLEDTNSQTLIGSSTSTKEETKTRLQYCKNSHDVLLYIRAFQGHTGGNVIASELMGHVGSIEYVLLMSFQSSNQDSSLEDEKAKKEDKPSSSHL